MRSRCWSGLGTGVKLNSKQLGLGLVLEYSFIQPSAAAFHQGVREAVPGVGLGKQS